MAVMSVLMGGIASAMLLASRAVPTDNTSLGAIADAERAAAEIATDLFACVGLPAQQAADITISVPDRNSDSNAETIRYRWLGVSGAALTREYNGGPSANVLDHVYEFALQYDTRTEGSKQLVTAVRIKLRASQDAATRVETCVPLLNAPDYDDGMVEPF